MTRAVPVDLDDGIDRAGDLYRRCGAGTRISGGSGCQQQAQLSRQDQSTFGSLVQREPEILLGIAAKEAFRSAACARDLAWLSSDE
jgi:hypothetical protein